MDEKTHQQLTSHTQKGDALFDQGKFREAFKEYVTAFELIPQPKEDYEAATWVLTAMGDCYFQLGAFEQARQALTYAMHCPGAISNPFIHLRLGQAQFELKNEARAKVELARAYMGAGQEIFAEEDPKYFAFVKSFMEGV